MVLRNANIYVTGMAENPNPKNAKDQVYKVRLNGTQIRTLVTCRASEIKKWIKFIEWKYRRNQRLIVGLGVQWHPNWKKNGDDYPADTLQLCIENHCLIIQLTQAESVPEILRKFLIDPSYTFVGINNTVDVMKLKNSVHNLTLDSKLVFNLAGYANIHPASITSMAVEFLELGGVWNDPKIGMSNWNAKQLSKYQVQYACVDAHVSYLIGHKVPNLLI